MSLNGVPFSIRSRRRGAVTHGGQVRKKSTRGWESDAREAVVDTNVDVLWMATRRKVLSIDEAIDRLILAGRSGIHSVPNRTLWQGALARAHQSGVAVYDTLFVELAARKRAPLATFDAALLKAFPNLAARPAKLIG